MAKTRFPAWHNPVPGWMPTRVDQGVDGTLSARGFCAPFKCRIIESIVDAPGWKGGWISAEILYGPFKGQGFYVAEGIKPLVKPGQVIPKGGIKIADRGPNGFFNPPLLGNIEAGWVAPNGNQPLCQLFGSHSDQDEVAITFGCAFNLFVVLCGGAGGRNESGLSPNWALLPSGLRKALAL